MFIIDIDFNGLDTNTQQFIMLSKRITKQTLKDINNKLNNNKTLDNNEKTIYSIIKKHCFNASQEKEKLQMEAFANKIGFGIDYSLIECIVNKAHLTHD